MPRAFDVTASTSQLQLGAGREAEVSFTVSNALRTPMRVRASLEPTGGARPGWMRLAQEEKELPPDGTAVFPVRVAVPPDAPPGDYAFKLLVVSVANPDEHYARGPSVAFTVGAAAPAPEKKAFPWWAVAVAAGVLLLGGVAIFLISRDGNGGGTGGGGVLPGLAQPCAAEEPQCAEGLVCTEGLCLGAEGFTRCAGNAQCASGRCEDGVCVAPPAEPGGACERDGDCAEPARCQDGRCRLPDGASCANAEQCVSGRCERGTCRARVEAGGLCRETEDCESPATCVRNRCVLPEGSRCDSGRECETGNCERGVCRAQPECSPPCEPGRECVRGRCAIVRRHCDSDRDCPSGQRCKDGLCRLPRGAPCATGSQCLSGRCENSRCR